MFPHSSFQTAGANPGPRTASLDLPGLFKHPLSLHGFWLINWIRNAPRTEIEEIYQKLGDLVADGSLSAAVERVYPLDQFKEAFKQSLKSNHSGKILFRLGAAHAAVISK